MRDGALPAFPLPPLALALPLPRPLVAVVALLPVFTEGLATVELDALGFVAVAAVDNEYGKVAEVLVIGDAVLLVLPPLFGESSV